MEYTYEFLRKCHGLRFRATIYDEFQEGVIKVMTDRVMLCYGEEDPGYLVTFGRRDTLSFSEQTFSILLSDFEIVPRDPEKYTDWQVGDMISKFNENNKIIFRGGDLVFFKAPSGEASGAFTYRELFEAGYRLVRTDVEETIWRKQNWEKFHPSDGDIIYLNFGDGRKEIMVFESLDEEEDVIRGYVSVNTDTGEMRVGPSLSGEYLRSVKSYRYADSDDKEYFFKVLAENGKRWNAEMKVVEDIEPESEEPVDVQKMIEDALEGYVPKGGIEGFPVEVIAKMLERQYEQLGKIDVSVFERNRASVAPMGFDWVKTEEGIDFWNSVICGRDFSEFFERYPKAVAPGAGLPFSFKKFDPVLMRDNDYERWQPQVFGRYGEESDDYQFYRIDGIGFRQCIPLNDSTIALVNRRDAYKDIIL